MNIARKLARQLAVLPIKDHRYIGIKQKLFFFHDLSQGSCFFLPRGAHIYNKLIDYLRKECKSRNYQEVITPNIFNSELWRQSGHWQHYEKNMIKFELADTEFSLKPMNCPGHCLLFQQQQPSIYDYDLPIRWADFGVLHRNELSGTLSGLTRVRRFQQDDAHIFCKFDQIEQEVKNCLSFARDVYEKFNFKQLEMKLSLRPETYLGDSFEWDQAEDGLRKALISSNIPFEEQKNEGAFYGPKIDLTVKDSRDKWHQCATIQLDFQLPEKFQLSYKDSKLKNTSHKPVIIHRAILGSFERFIAMLAENCDARWPFWLSPMQIIVIPIHENLNNYAQEVNDELKKNKFWTNCDLRSELKLNGKIREALLLRYHFIVIVGRQEFDSKTITCRVIERSTAIENDKVQSSPLSLSENSEEIFKDKDADDDKKIRGGRITNEKREDYGGEVENVIIHNINLPLIKFVEYLKKFDELETDRADLELLRLASMEQQPSKCS